MNIAEIKTGSEYASGIERLSSKKSAEIPVSGNKVSFAQMLDNLRAVENSSAIVSQEKSGSAFASTASDMRLPGDYISSFKLENPGKADYEKAAQGMASCFGKSGGKVLEKYTVDKTSKLYEQALELESYFVKVMIDSMRKTLSGKTLSGDESFAGKMYKDMMYEELGRNVTKNAGFGLADQIYLELYRKNASMY